MRLRVFMLIGLMVGIVALIHSVSRRGKPAGELIGITNSAPAARASFKALARSSAAASAEILDAPVSVHSVSNLFQRLMDNEDSLKLTPEQWAEYLRQYGTNAETLLATQQTNYLRLAAEMYPNDPRVQFAVLSRDLYPEARRDWLDRFKQSAPDNAVADYFSAREYFKAGDREKALNDLVSAAGKPNFDDYSAELALSIEEAQLSAGRSMVEAKIASTSENTQSHLALFKGVGLEIQQMEKDYLGAGDSASAQAVAQWGDALSQRLLSGESVLGRMVGLGIDRAVLNSLPADSQPPFLNGTVQQRLEDLKATRESLRAISTDTIGWLTTANDNDVISYFERYRLQGEYKARLWLQNRNSLR